MAVIEILDVSLTEPVSARLRGRNVETAPGSKTAGHLAQFSGWVLGRESAAVAVELLNGSSVCRRVPVNIHRPGRSRRLSRDSWSGVQRVCDSDERAWG
jgi:hypothetical protein